MCLRKWVSSQTGHCAVPRKKIGIFCQTLWLGQEQETSFADTNAPPLRARCVSHCVFRDPILGVSLKCKGLRWQNNIPQN
eukprot:1942873-Rhodomonas_salina.2